VIPTGRFTVSAVAELVAREENGMAPKAMLVQSVQRNTNHPKIVLSADMGLSKTSLTFCFLEHGRTEIISAVVLVSSIVLDPFVIRMS
jgi:hypothetical protein